MADFKHQIIIEVKYAKIICRFIYRARVEHTENSNWNTQMKNFIKNIKSKYLGLNIIKKKWPSSVPQCATNKN